MNTILKKAAAFMLMMLICMGSIPGYAEGEAAGNAAALEKGTVFFSENFESGTTGNDWTTLTGWQLSRSWVVGQTLDSSYTVALEPGSSNKVGRIYRSDSTANSMTYLMFNTFDTPTSGSIIALDFRLYVANENCGTIVFSVADTNNNYMMNYIKFKEGIIESTAYSQINSSEALQDTGWYDFQLLFDFREEAKKVTISVKRESDKREIQFGSMTFKSDFTFNGSISKFTIGSHATTGGKGALFYADDISIYQMKEPEALVINGSPQNGKTDVDVSDNVFLALNYALDVSELSKDNVSVSGEGAEVKSVSTDPMDSKRCMVEFEKPLCYGTSYSLTFSNLKDIYGRTAPNYTVQFVTKDNEVLKTPTRFYRDFQNERVDITDFGLEAGTVYCSVSMKENAEANIAVALYSNRQLVQVLWQKNTEPLTTVDVTIPENPSTYSLCVYVWDDEGMRPLAPASQLDYKEKKIYYVSPSGSDSNPGTQEQPWKTMSKAAQTLTAGETAIFENGIYTETEGTLFKNSGGKGAPITLKARNKHGAKIVYAASLNGTPKLWIYAGKKNIVIKDFEITQTSPAHESNTKATMDVLISCWGDDSEIVGNKIHNAYEDGIKVTASVKNVLVEDNIISNISHEGIDVFHADNVVVRGNEFRECGRVGIMVKGGSKNAKVYNNLICNESVPMITCGINIGGISNSYDPPDVAEGTGFELYNGVFYNNVVYSGSSDENPYLIATGIAYKGAVGCHSYNNVIIGTMIGFDFDHNKGLENGWGWNVPNVDSVVKNNIVMDCERGMVLRMDPQGTFDVDYNLFYNIASEQWLEGTYIPQQTHPISGNPLFCDKSSDWHLQSGSPAIGAGVAMPTQIAGYGNSIISIDHVDYENTPRQTPWDLGVYNYTDSTSFHMTRKEGGV